MGIEMVDPNNPDDPRNYDFDDDELYLSAMSRNGDEYNPYEHYVFSDMDDYDSESSDDSNSDTAESDNDQVNSMNGSGGESFDEMEMLRRLMATPSPIIMKILGFLQVISTLQNDSLDSNSIDEST